MYAIRSYYDVRLEPVRGFAVKQDDEDAMPIVAHNDLPTFARLRQEGQTILTPERAVHQTIRELHIGLLNMMPDAALAATERQFFRLVGESNPIAQFYMHPRITSYNVCYTKLLRNSAQACLPGYPTSSRVTAGV